jgi:hypothetical protein
MIVGNAEVVPVGLQRTLAVARVFLACTSCRVRRADVPELCNRTHTLGDMLNINIAPFVFQILSDEATVTMVWLFFAA